MSASDSFGPARTKGLHDSQAQSPYGAAGPTAGTLVGIGLGPQTSSSSGAPADAIDPSAASRLAAVLGQTTSVVGPPPDPTVLLGQTVSIPALPAGSSTAAFPSPVAASGEQVAMANANALANQMHAQQMAQQMQAQMAVAGQMAAMSMAAGMMPGAFGGVMPGMGMPGLPGFGMPVMPAVPSMPSMPSIPSMQGMPAAPDPNLLAAALSSTGPEGVMAASALAANSVSFQMPFAGLPVASVAPVGGLGSVAPRMPKRNTLAQKRANEERARPTGPLPKLTQEELEDPLALINAANERDELRCRAILQHGDFAGINAKDDDGRSALLVATLRKLPEDICLAILKHPNFKEVNAIDRWGNSALINAASKGFATVCEAVLDRKEFTAVNCKDKWGATALHWAADMNLSAVCDKLLAHPGFVEANMVAFSFCFENKTALQVADARGNTLAGEVIRKHLQL